MDAEASPLTAFQRAAVDHFATLLKRRRWPSIDALTVASRRPLRTVLLSLAEIGRAEEAAIEVAFYPRGEGQQPRQPALIPSELVDAYCEATAVRAEPALIWGQRRLTAGAAIERSSYVLQRLPGHRGRILFLGDDDLVSPLIAAVAGEWDVEVWDVDPVVLNEVDTVSRRLGGNLKTRQVDLQRAHDVRGAETDVVVADPFPSGDGSFEGFFWATAARTLVRGGLLFSTIAPSHKPRGYEKGAASVLRQLGFLCREIAVAQSRYEVFAFELSRIERDFLSELTQVPTVHHTKDAFAAVLSADAARVTVPAFDYAEWQAAASSHYLNGFARRAGGGARFLELEPGSSREDVEPTLVELWAIAYESWSRFRFGNDAGALT